MAAIDWYFARGNKQMGPLSAADLRRLAAAGELSPDDLIWREGLAEWTKARNVRGLFEEESKPAGGEEIAVQAGGGVVPGRRAGRRDQRVRAGRRKRLRRGRRHGTRSRRCWARCGRCRTGLYRSGGPRGSGVRLVRPGSGDALRRRLRRHRNRQDHDAGQPLVRHRPVVAAGRAAIRGRQVLRRARSAQPRDRRPPGLAHALRRRGLVEPGGGAGRAAGIGAGGRRGVDVSIIVGGIARLIVHGYLACVAANPAS